MKAMKNKVPTLDFNHAVPLMLLAMVMAKNLNPCGELGIYYLQ
jgi:hypothetical protein